MRTAIRRESVGSPAAAILISALDAELSARYTEDGANHFRLDADELVEGRGAFLVAYVDGRAAGCGAIRKLDAETAEIKRMFVTPPLRGRGIARAILGSLEAEGARLGVRRIVLETGTRQSEAIALYEGSGYSRIPLFGEYVGAPCSICMAKEITA